MKARPDWRRTSQVKKLKIFMVLVACALVISVAVCGTFAWLQLKPTFGMTIGSTSSVSSEASEEENGAVAVNDDSFPLVLVNNTSPISSSFKLQLTTFNGIQVDSRIVSDLQRMINDAEKDKCHLTVTGGYVDGKKQDQLFQAEVANLTKSKGYSKVKAENDAQLTVPRGGNSEFQTGLAITVSAAGGNATADFSTTNEYKWLLNNSVNYGFIQRLPEDKCWTSNSPGATGMKFCANHFRYVGVDNAKKMRTLQMCLEEYSQYVANQNNT
ncbi:MAG TPA: M15 family metallopeptidase [Oscillospiraceae bacterium]|nr:M15 family metallopeptidase [Oscillospiraceae bacterium]